MGLKFEISSISIKASDIELVKEHRTSALCVSTIYYKRAKRKESSNWCFAEYKLYKVQNGLFVEEGSGYVKFEDVPAVMIRKLDSFLSLKGYGDVRHIFSKEGLEGKIFEDRMSRHPELSFEECTRHYRNKHRMFLELHTRPAEWLSNYSEVGYKLHIALSDSLSRFSIRGFVRGDSRYFAKEVQLALYRAGCHHIAQMFGLYWFEHYPYYVPVVLSCEEGRDDPGTFGYKSECFVDRINPEKVIYEGDTNLLDALSDRMDMVQWEDILPM